MNCEYCGTRLFTSDRRCPQCGAPIKSDVNNKEKLKKENKRFIASICDSYVYYDDRIVAIGKTLIDSTTDTTSSTNGFYFYKPVQFFICDFEIREPIKNFLYSVKLTATLYEENEECVETGKRSLFFPKSNVSLLNDKNILLVKPLPYSDKFLNIIYGYIQEDNE